MNFRDKIKDRGGAGKYAGKAEESNKAKKAQSQHGLSPDDPKGKAPGGKTPDAKSPEKKHQAPPSRHSHGGGAAAQERGKKEKSGPGITPMAAQAMPPDLSGGPGMPGGAPPPPSIGPDPSNSMPPSPQGPLPGGGQDLNPYG